MRLKNNLNSLLYSFIILAVIKPMGLAYYSQVNKFFQMCKLLALFFMLFVLVMHEEKVSQLVFGKKNLRKGIMAFSVFTIIYVVNTIRRNIECRDLLNNCITCFLLFLFIYIVNKSQRKEELNTSIYFVFSFYIICQVASMILERIGIVLLRTNEGDPTYFFGTDNYSAFTVVPMMGVLLYLGRNNPRTNKYRCRDWALLILTTLCYCWTGSVTAACSLLIMILWLCLVSINKKSAKVFSAKNLLIVLIVALLLIMVGNIQNHMGTILRLVGKEERGFSLNSRTYIWECALRLIKQHPIIGIGNLSDEEIRNYALYGTGHAHNIILELLLRSGIIGLISYLYFLIYPFVKYRKYFINPRSVVLMLTVFVYLILSFMDSYPLIQAPIVLISFIYVSID